MAINDDKAWLIWSGCLEFTALRQESLTEPLQRADSTAWTILRRLWTPLSWLQECWQALACPCNRRKSEAVCLKGLSLTTCQLSLGPATALGRQA